MPDIWQRYSQDMGAKDLPYIYAWYMKTIYLKYVGDMPEIYLIHTWVYPSYPQDIHDISRDMPVMCQRHAWNFLIMCLGFWICLEYWICLWDSWPRYSQDIPEIFRRYLWYIQEIFPRYTLDSRRYLWYIQEIFPRSVRDIPKI